jgi:hypothetical protein
MVAMSPTRVWLNPPLRSTFWIRVRPSITALAPGSL